MIPFLLPLSGMLNPAKILAFVVQYWKELLLAAMVSTLLYQNFSETRFVFGAETIPSLEMRLDAATKAVDVCKAGNVKLTEAIDERNAEVVKWKEITSTLQDDIDNLSTELDDMRQTTKKDVATILKDPTPKTCEDAIEYLREGRKDLQW